MNHEREQFLALETKPARLSVEETAWYLGFNESEISILLALGMLKPIGHPPKNGRKYFALVELERLRNNSDTVPCEIFGRHRQIPSTEKQSPQTRG